ncbi:hypothetical protein BN7_4849 [Wickerhamomyces ciferrii]|uniref:Uncharacterized protein n=1 Tax=Wickerhamomyces ciferrii (strain ATCC 14091 / BCRC 22168 / CBS 111 / JCM 3599 / NBRC 0793 / NRRL Y-1031 F-60-10) TaxID=1206466 RepID=K0KTD7_WICCF|nr:uncharacterized protein BN7_4849 [Wickerhamomyces ciferrii]CCH45267.1 hypothetical protein BN7_4849 [Wickerhamomyces ciferrii]
MNIFNFEVPDLEPHEITLPDDNSPWNDYELNYKHNMMEKYIHYSIADLSSVRITGRRFSSEVETKSIIEKVVKAVTNNQEGQNQSQRTLFFTGYEDSFIQLPLRYYRIDYRPVMKLIKK